MARILVVDDDHANRELIRLALAKAGHQVEAVGDLERARQALAKAPPDLVVSDLWLVGETGLDLLGEIRQGESPPPVILVTARGTVETAAAAARIGAFDYLAKPFDVEELRARVSAALAPAAAPPPEAPEEGPESLLVGSHPSMVALYKAIARVAPLRIPVLLLGETGTGKELVARALHRLGRRPEGPFVAVNCGAIPDTLLESELFGHAKGAFTDARRDHRGALGRADGGTAFLDEVGEVSPSFQVKVLRFLEDGVLSPVGSEQGEAVDVRVVAATNRDLPALVADGRFRSDLWYRLAGYEIRIPPLRERSSDLPLLVEHLRRRAAREAGLPSAGGASPELLAVLAGYDWPGNVRQLDLAVRRILVDSGGLVDADAARRVIATFGGGAGDRPAAGEPSALGSLDEIERRHVLAVLESTGGNRSEAARILGIERKTLRRKLERFGAPLASNEEEEEEESP